MFNFWDWILDYENSEIVLKEVDSKEIQLETSYGLGYVFSWPDNVFEFKVINKKDDKTEFYLHFQLSDEQHGKELFAEFVECLLKLKNKQKTRVLLCCSSALTTMYFAEKLNEVANLLGNDYEFNAVSYSRLYELAFNYDMIALAPQISYLYKNIQDVLKDKIVVKIPTAIFGSYDANEAFKFFDKVNNPKEKEEEFVPQMMRKIDTKKRLLVVGVLREIDSARIVYRVYDKGVAVDEELTIKEGFTIKDIEDIIDLVFLKDKNIDGICVSMPGIVTHGVVDLPTVDINQVDVRRLFTDRYHVPVVICNNANAIALGIYSSQDKYHSIVYHSQMAGSINSGEGIVCYGKLITGLRGFAGELWYLAPHVYVGEKILKEIWTVEGATEVVARMLMVPICTVAPKAIYVRCRLTPDMEAIRNVLKYFIPEQYIPDLIPLESTREYMLLGELMICIEELNERERMGVVV